MYKPAQFPWIVNMFGDWQSLRIVHFASVSFGDNICNYSLAFTTKGRRRRTDRLDVLVVF
jgi:thiosulfate reductase cytochrome b subunit